MIAKTRLTAAAVFAVAFAAIAEPVKQGLWKEFTYDVPDTTPIIYGGESRAENVRMSDYCIYLDIYYADGSTTWGERAEFAGGTHGWQKVCGAIVPRKPVKRIQMNALCRNGERADKAEFRDFFLERREGRGDRLYEVRRSNRPFADTDTVFYEFFKGRTKMPRSETVAAAAGSGSSPLADGSVAVWTASSMRKISPLTFPEEHERRADPQMDLAVARRGAASAQILVSTANDVEWTDGSLRLPLLKDSQGRALKGRIEWQRVGYLPRGTYIIPHPLSSDPSEGWVPDPLLPAAPFRVRKASTQALWVTVSADADAVAGLYEGEAEVLERGQVRGRVRLSVMVRDFALPKTFGLDAAFALMDGFLRATYPQSWRAMRRQAQDILLDHRLNPDDITRTAPPEIDDLLHARARGMSGFTILNIVPEPKNPNSLWSCFASPSEVFCDAFYPAFKARLAPYVAELRRLGLDRFARLYGFDERGGEYYGGMRELCGKLKADFPDLPVLTSSLLYKDAAAQWNAFSAGRTNLNAFLVTDIYCPLTANWKPELSAYLRTEGKKVYWYTCSGPRWPYANFASYEFPPIEGRLVLGFQTHLFRADGFLFWHVNNWKGKANAPMDTSDTFFPEWSTRDSLRCPGDGVFLYPAKDRVLPSIRLAQLRDGVQDYEWLRMAEAKKGRKAVDAVSRRIVRTLTDFTRDPAAVRNAMDEIGDMIDGGASRRIAGVPQRHLPKRIMGRDYWPALYKFGDWLPRTNWKTSTSAVRFDNPDIFKLPAFRDFAPVYWARRDPPPYDSGKALWRSFADNFRADEPDREIIAANPHPERPFLFTATSKRPCLTWGLEKDLDQAEYEEWCAKHPNALYDGAVAEWDNDLMMAYGRLDNPTRQRNPINFTTNDARVAAVKAFLGPKPRNRYERMDAMRRLYADRKAASYSGRMAAHTSNVLSIHLGADCGAQVIGTEMTNTSGSPNNDTEYRWNMAPMFTRGAARQFGIPWEWYWAAYMNGFRHTGEWHNNAVCEYPAVKKTLPAVMNHGPEFGTSASLMRRLYYFSYLNGANVTQPEEWSAYFLTWDDKAGKTVLTDRGRDYADYHNFTQAHPNRGAMYTPVAVCVPLSRGYTAYGGWAWADDSFAYTTSDLMSDAVFFSLVPGFERAKAMKRGVETNLHNSRFAQMYDVICPDAPSQTPETVLDVMKSYRALIVAGEFDDPKVERCLAEYEKGGGRVLRIDAAALPKPNGSLVGRLKAGKVSFPKVESMLEWLQKDYFPFRVEGDCLYGANRTGNGWWLWVFNNKGVTKFTDVPHTIDHSFDADITVSYAKYGISSARELLSGKQVPVSGGAFRHRVAAGDLAVFEVK